MTHRVKKDIFLINTAGVMGVIYWRLALGEILLYFVTKCLGISKEDWALVASILPVASVLHFASAYLAEHLGHRKLLSLTCFAVARLAVPAIMIVPFITRPEDTTLRLYYLAAALIAHASITALGASAWLSWVADIVPSDHRGRFWSTRMATQALFDNAFFIAAGVLLAWPRFSPEKPLGYLLVFGFAFLMGELDLLIHAFVPDRPMPPPEERVRFSTLLVGPWRHGGFRNLMVFRVVNTFGAGVVGPFAFMYMIEELGLSTFWVAVLFSINSLASVIAVDLWRKIGDRVGYRTVASISLTMSATGLIYWWFLPKGQLVLVLCVMAVAKVWHGAAVSGWMLSVNTLNMDVAPEKHRSVYFAQVTVVLALVLGLSTFCGRAIYIQFNPRLPVYFLGTQMTGLHVLLGVFALLRFLAVKVFLPRVPEAKAEAALPRIERLLRTNAFRIFPTLLFLERPPASYDRAEYTESIRELVPGSADGGLHPAVRSVLQDPVHQEREFYSALDHERDRRGKGLERLLAEAAESAELHIAPARARAAVKRITRLYGKGDLAACLRTIHRLAHRTADRWNSSTAGSALLVIDALADNARAGGPCDETAVLLAVYAYLQIVREPEKNGP